VGAPSKPSEPSAVWLWDEREPQEVGRLSEKQTAAEKMAALVGMTTDDSEQYKERHKRIKKLTKELALDGQR
jgi:hypothetical protein